MSEDPEQPAETGTRGNTTESGAAGGPRRAAPGGAAGDVATGHVGTPPGTIATGDRQRGEHVAGRQDLSAASEGHDAFWRESFGHRDYTDESLGYDHYRDAYRYGWESRRRAPQAVFEEEEPRLRKDWDGAERRLEWEQARPAIRDAWRRAGGNTDASTPGNPLA